MNAKSMTASLAALGIAIFLAGGSPALAVPTVVTGYNNNDEASPAFAFSKVPPPSKGDAAEKAVFQVITGERDRNGGDTAVLHDGRLPAEADEPGANFFFRAGTAGGWLRVDLGRVIEIKRIASYSWHPGSRGPQVYTLYASDGLASGFELQPLREARPDQRGWQTIAAVDTRGKGKEPGGQYGVSIAPAEGTLGKFRYLLFDIARTADADPFAHTFYSEIDVIEAGSEVVPIPFASAVAAPPFVIWATNRSCSISINTAQAPDLKDWAEKKLGPVLAEWYPELAALLGSTGYTAPARFTVELKPGRGVAATAGTRITANSIWIKAELEREALGALLHEEVHVIQQYGRARRNSPEAKAPPGWLVEGIPDYLRWFKYEPQSHGADIVWMRGLRNFTPRYDAGYRVSANFLNYASEKYDTNLVTKLNAACREHRETGEVFKKSAGKTLSELNDEWVKWVQEELAPK